MRGLLGTVPAPSTEVMKGRREPTAASHGAAWAKEHRVRWSHSELRAPASRSNMYLASTASALDSANAPIGWLQPATPGRLSKDYRRGCVEPRLHGFTSRCHPD